MYRIDNRFHLSIIFNDYEYPLEHSTFDFVQINSSVNFFLPMARISIRDTYHIFKDHVTLADGIQIIISIGTDSQNAQQFDFRLFNFTHKTMQDQTIQYTIDCILNHPLYFNLTTTKAIKGTSASAIRQIAKSCGFFQMDIDETADAQTWLPMNAKNCVFAKKIAEHGYVNDSSCMVLAIDPSDTLLYKNFSNIKFDDQGGDNKIPTFLFGGVGDGQNSFTVNGRQHLSKGGLLNNYAGYKYKTVSQSVLSKTAAHTKVNTRRIANNLMLNKELNKKIEDGRVHFAPIDCGNVHSNHSRAKHQNLRIAAMQSFGLLVVVSNQTNVSLLDPVKYSVVDNSGSSKAEMDRGYGGNYIVSAKTIYANAKGNYFEKFEFIRDGLNTDPDKKQTQV